MDKNTLAALLNGREYGNEITLDEAAQAKAAGLVVVFGVSDDNVSFKGAIDEQIGCYGGSVIEVTRKGIVPTWDRYDKKTKEEAIEYFDVRNAAGGCHEIRVEWCKGNGYAWSYEAKFPRASFEIMEEGERFCRGFVFSIDEAFPITGGKV